MIRTRLFIVRGFFLVIAFIGLSDSISSQDISDIELYQQTETEVFFDYRLHRNPLYIYSKLDSTDTFHTHTHLFRGNAIVTRNNQGFAEYGGTTTFSKAYKLDLQLRPLVVQEFGRFSDPVRNQVSLAPRLAYNIRGFYAIAQWVLPIINEFNRTGLGQRPGEIGLGYTKIWAGRSFVNLFAGTFTNNRYGFYGEFIQSILDSRLYTGLSVYQTGGLLYDDNVFFRENIGYFSGNIRVLYRFRHPDISVQLSGERFLQDDIGLSFEVFRQFGNTDIGFSVTKSSNGDNAAIFVVLPFFARKIFTNKWFNLRPPNSFSYTYDLRPDTGIALSTRPYTRFDREIYRFNKHYLNGQLRE